MKFESIKSSKFDMFQEHSIVTLLNITGGRHVPTKKGDGSFDCWDDSCGNDIHCTDGSSYDVCGVAATDGNSVVGI